MPRLWIDERSWSKVPPGGALSRLARLQMVAEVLPSCSADGEVRVMTGYQRNPVGRGPSLEVGPGVPLEGETALLLGAEFPGGTWEPRVLGTQAERWYLCGRGTLQFSVEIYEEAIYGSSTSSGPHWWRQPPPTSANPDTGVVRPLLGEAGPMTLQEWSEVFGAGWSRSVTLRLLRVVPPVYRLSFRALMLLAGFCLLWTAAPVAGMFTAALLLLLVVSWTRLDRRMCRWQRQQDAPDWRAALDAWQRQDPDVVEETDADRGNGAPPSTAGSST